jgi:hypothetical protein
VSDLEWSWLAAPYIVCAAGMLAVALFGALVRGDRVMRIGMMGAAMTALPWALCSAVSTCTQDPVVATRLLRLGNGPIAFVGPNLLLVLLGASGQLERYRWVARVAGLCGVVLLALCWATPWTIPGVHRIPAGIYYVSAGPLTGVHFLQLAVWLVFGLVIARRSVTAGERRGVIRVLFGVFALGAVGATDMLLVYDIAGVYPVAWFPTLVACALALYLVLYTDLLRPQGLDRGVVIELFAFVATFGVVAVVGLATATDSPLLASTIGGVAWVVLMGTAWGVARRRPAPAADDRRLDAFVAQLVDVDQAGRIAAQLAGLWRQAIGIEVRATWVADGEMLHAIGGARPPRTVDPDIATWLVVHNEPLAILDLATMRLGGLRGKLEALGMHGVQLIVPLVDRGSLVGLVEADYGRAMREEERGLVADSARAAARALTYVALAKTAARERETAREVEVAEAMRLQASASRDDELGRWGVAVEYRSASRTTGAGWSATLLSDGRLAVMVTEAQANGLPAALASAALTGAFAAATLGARDLRLDELLANLRASAEGVVRGGEPVAAFIAILDAEARKLEWACAGHPGGHLVPYVAYDMMRSGDVPRPQAIALGAGVLGNRLGESLKTESRGVATLAPDSMMVVASTGLRGNDDDKWATTLRALGAAGSRLAALAVESVLAGAEPREDLLAVVVRYRPERPSEPVVTPS